MKNALRVKLAAALHRRAIVIPTVVLAATALIAGLWFIGHSGSNAIWNQPPAAISDVLDRVDQGQIASANINGQRIVVTDTSGHQSWTIEKDAAMGSTEQYLRQHNVKVAVESTDDTSLTSMLPNLLGLIVLMALLFIMIRRSNVLGNPMGAMTKHLAEPRGRIPSRSRFPKSSALTRQSRSSKKSLNS